jgi:hypothetical protein
MPTFVWLLNLTAIAEMGVFAAYAAWLLWPAVAQ